MSKSTDLLSTDDLRLRLERTWIQHIKLCQDNFLYFVKNVWPEFICKTEKNPDDWGHHQIIAKYPQYSKGLENLDQSERIKFFDAFIESQHAFADFMNPGHF